jgi:hypothetical protein
VIHYHGTPLTPRARLLELAGRCFCVSFAQPQDLKACHEIGQSVMLDNGAFSIWRAGKGDVDLDAYAAWARPWLDYRTTWCVIPDKIDGTEEENDQLLAAWFQHRLPFEQCAPVWHMHESLERLVRLCAGYPRVCLGSSGEFATVGDDRWHRRMTAAMDKLCGDGPAPCWLHMLRGLALSGSDYPFASADSTNVARNHLGSPSPVVRLQRSRERSGSKGRETRR